MITLVLLLPRKKHGGEGKYFTSPSSGRRRMGRLRQAVPAAPTWTTGDASAAAAAAEAGSRRR